MAVEVVYGTVEDQRVDSIAVAGRHEGLRAGQVSLETDATGKFKGIIRVVDHDESGASSERIVELAVRSVLAVVEEESFFSVAMPVLGAGSLPESQALAAMLHTIYELRFMGEVVIVRSGR